MTQKKKTYIFSMIFGITLIFIAVFAVFFMFAEIKKDSNELLLERRSLASFSQEMENLQESRMTYETNQASLEKINSQFVNAEIPVEFIKFLEKTAQDSRLSIGISPSTETQPEDLPASLVFQLSADGFFSDFLKFLEKLENSSYLIEVVNLNLTRTTGEGEKASAGDMNALLLIRVAAK